MSDPQITITMSRETAEYIQNGLSDLLCWCRGYMAAAGDHSDNGPIGVEETRDMNIKLKEAISLTEMFG